MEVMEPSSSSSQPPPVVPPSTTTTTTSAATAAMEVSQLVVCVSAMWSRHRDSLRAMACEGEIGGEEAQRVVEYMGHELRDLGDMMMMNKGDRHQQYQQSSDDEHDDGGSSSGSEEVMETEEYEKSQVSLSSSRLEKHSASGWMDG